MPKHSDDKLQKHTLLLFEGDYKRLGELYKGQVETAKVIRHLIRAHINKLDPAIDISQLQEPKNEL